eukprot:TRINITY_DN2514_c0_g1_i1.p1 TRINITY_DN2514_c0_g1~~TRINITY_DN2514_c0_g1_i1.p1  ORF type:complete len:291 (+),score=86.34 TRINITY_DN2514_c0_g1_i1:80-952(+)
MKEYDKLEPEVAEFISNQHLFFVATSPVLGGHVNVSPKGQTGTFKFISPATASVASGYRFPTDKTMACFAFLDLGGSGIETHSHLHTAHNNITVCFLSFEGAPNIYRLFGRGVSVEPGEKGWDELVDEFDKDVVDNFFARGSNATEAKVRNIVVVNVERIRQSCGYGVPLMTYLSDRSIFPSKFQKLPEETRISRNQGWNAKSMDGLPGLRWVNYSSPLVPASEEIRFSNHDITPPPSSSSSPSASSSSSSSSLLDSSGEFIKSVVSRVPQGMYWFGLRVVCTIAALKIK